MKKLSLLLLFFSTFGFAQNYQEDFKKHFQKSDTLQQRKTLQLWEKANSKDPELFAGYFNYYFSKAKSEIVTLTSAQPKGESLSINDKTDKPVGYLGSMVNYNPNHLKNAFDKIDAGIKLYPNRLDFRFGKIYALGQVENWEAFTAEVIKTIAYSNTNKNQWTWTNNATKEDAADFMLSSIQNYQLQLYNTENDALLPNMRSIAEEILKYYPNHVESLSNISITYLITHEFDKALEYMFRAEKIDPKDTVVLSNIAHAYKLQENKEKAIEYYEKIVAVGNDEAKTFAQDQIQKLKK